MLHHIQKNILDLLATADSRRYGELKPIDLDGNVCGYHLTRLIVQKVVEKTVAGSYQRTMRGKNAIIHRHEDPVLQAHSILLIVIRCGDKWLVRKRLVQPLLGKVGFVHGEPDAADESVIITAKRRLKEKIGLDVELSVTCSGLIRIFTDNELQSYSHAVVLYGETDAANVLPSDATGENSWSSLDDETIDWLPSCKDIVNCINTHTSWFDISYTV